MQSIGSNLYDELLNGTLHSGINDMAMTGSINIKVNEMKINVLDLNENIF